MYVFIFKFFFFLLYYINKIYIIPPFDNYVSKFDDVALNCIATASVGDINLWFISAKHQVPLRAPLHHYNVS